MALADRKHKRRIFEKQGSGKDRMDDNKITRLSASFAANIHIDHPELPDAAEGMLYALQGIEEDVEELHRYLSNDDLAVNVTGNATTATNLTVGDKTLRGNLTVQNSINLGHATDTTVSRSAAGEVTIEGSKIITENSVKHVLNCGWVGSTNARQYLPFGAGGVTYTTNPKTWSEMGAFIAPADGEVDHIIIRCSGVAGNSTVGVHIASNGTEMPTFNMGTFTTNTVKMTVDDTSYKFSNFTNAGGTHNSFSAGDIIVVSFDPTGYPADAVATMVLNLNWTSTL